MTLPAYLKYIGLTLFFTVAAVNFTRTTLSVIESSRRLEELKEDVAGLQSQKTVLEEEVEYRQTGEFVEREAREKLGLVKPGEEIFVVQQVLGKISDVNSVETKSRSESVPQAWIDLFSLF